MPPACKDYSKKLVASDIVYQVLVQHNQCMETAKFRGLMGLVADAGGERSGRMNYTASPYFEHEKLAKSPMNS